MRAASHHRDTRDLGACRVPAQQRIRQRGLRTMKVDDIYWQVRERRASFPGAPLIKIRPDWRENRPPSGPAAELFIRQLSSAETILDVGAGDRYWRDVLERLGIDASYQSVDVESEHAHDFDDFFAV